MIKSRSRIRHQLSQLVPNGKIGKLNHKVFHRPKKKLSKKKRRSLAGFLLVLQLLGRSPKFALSATNDWNNYSRVPIERIYRGGAIYEADAYTPQSIFRSFRINYNTYEGKPWNLFYTPFHLKKNLGYYKGKMLEPNSPVAASMDFFLRNQKSEAIPFHLRSNSLTLNPKQICPNVDTFTLFALETMTDPEVQNLLSELVTHSLESMKLKDVYPSVFYRFKELSQLGSTKLKNLYTNLWNPDLRASLLKKADINRDGREFDFKLQAVNQKYQQKIESLKDCQFQVNQSRELWEKEFNPMLKAYQKKLSKMSKKYQKEVDKIGKEYQNEVNKIGKKYQKEVNKIDNFNLGSETETNFIQKQIEDFTNNYQFDTDKELQKCLQDASPASIIYSKDKQTSKTLKGKQRQTKMPTNINKKQYVYDKNGTLHSIESGRHQSHQSTDSFESLSTKNLTFVRDNNVYSINFERVRDKWKHFLDFQDYGVETPDSIDPSIIEKLKQEKLNPGTILINSEKKKQMGKNLTLDEVNNIRYGIKRFALNPSQEVRPNGTMEAERDKKMNTTHLTRHGTHITDWKRFIFFEEKKTPSNHSYFDYFSGWEMNPKQNTTLKNDNNVN